MTLFKVVYNKIDNNSETSFSVSCLLGSRISEPPSPGYCACERTPGSCRDLKPCPWSLPLSYHFSLTHSAPTTLTFFVLPWIGQGHSCLMSWALGLPTAGSVLVSLLNMLCDFLKLRLPYTLSHGLPWSLCMLQPTFSVSLSLLYVSS